MADGDITKVEVMPDIAKWVLEEVKFSVSDKICIVTYHKVDSSDNTISSKFIEFKETEFTQLITAINNGSNIKTTIKNAVKIKLGL